MTRHSILLTAAIAVLAGATSAGAAFVVGPEIQSGALSNRTSLHYPAQAVAIARDANGIAIAWSMREGAIEESIFIARLDDAGQLSGEIKRLDHSVKSHRVAFYPSMAPSPDGKGFILAWVELEELNSPRATGAISVVDASLEQIATHPVSITAFSVDNSFASPPIVKSYPSGVAWVGINGRLWIVGDDGVPVKAPLDLTPESDFSFPEGRPLFAERQNEQMERICPPPCRWVHGGLGWCSCGTLYRSRSKFNFIWYEALAFTLAFPSETESGPAVESHGRDTLIVWTPDPSAAGGNVVAMRLDTASFSRFAEIAQSPLVLGTFGPDYSPIRPDIASDGDRFLVVWQTKTSGYDHDIAGAFVDRNGSVTSFAIATSVADERDPSVIAAGPGRFLVAYETIFGGERRIAGRFVTTSQRRRAVR